MRKLSEDEVMDEMNEIVFETFQLSRCLVKNMIGYSGYESA